MGWYHWVIVILVLISWAQYTHPAKTGFVGTVFDPVNNFISSKNPLSKPACTDTIDYVCGSDGVTYDNVCKATLAGVSEISPGQCGE